VNGILEHEYQSVQIIASLANTNIQKSHKLYHAKPKNDKPPKI